MRLIPVLVLITLLLSVPIPAGAQSATPAAASPVAASGDFAGLVDIGGGREMYLMCRGEGSPTVILEAGYGNDADNWDTVALRPRLRRRPRCSRGWPPSRGSVPTTVPGRSSTSITAAAAIPCPCRAPRRRCVADLHALLSAAAIPGPYVLAGHSFGGLIVRLYAATYPDEVVGLVLIDAAHEDYYDEVQAVLASAQLAASTPTRGRAEPTIPDFERIDIDASTTAMREAAAASPLRPIPLVVLTHGLPWDWPDGYPVAALEADLGAAAGRTGRVGPG